MTLFDTEAAPIVRSRKPLPKAGEKPKWNKYTVKTPQRCDECVEVAYEAMPGPMPGIRQARFSRRQSGVTRLYCAEHANEQRDEDRRNYNIENT